MQGKAHCTGVIDAQSRGTGLLGTHSIVQTEGRICLATEMRAVVLGQFTIREIQLFSFRGSFMLLPFFQVKKLEIFCLLLPETFPGDSKQPRIRVADCFAIYYKTRRQEIQQLACLKHTGRSGRSSPEIRNQNLQFWTGSWSW